MVLALSTKAKIAAATLTAVSVIGGAFAADAQQAAQPNFAHCDRIADNGRQAECYMDTRIAFNRARSAAAEVQIRANQTQIRANETQIADNVAESSCSKQLVEIATNPTRRALGQQLLAGKTVEQYGACNLLRALSNS